MRYTLCALAGLWLGSLLVYALYLAGVFWPLQPGNLIAPAQAITLGATVGAWCGALLGLSLVLQPDERYIETYGCPFLLMLLGVSLAAPYWAPTLFPGPGGSLAYLLAPPLGLGFLSSTVRTPVSPLLGLGMLAWVGAMLLYIQCTVGLSAAQVGTPLLGVIGVFFAAGAARRALGWQLPKMRGSVKIDD